MIVKSVSRVSPSSDEAEVVVEGGGLQCKCFCQPCHVEVGQVLTSPLFAFNTQDLYRSDQAAQLFDLRGRFSYRIVGELRALKPAVVRVGSIDIKLDATPPGDLRIGATVEFECERLDVID